MKVKWWDIKRPRGLLKSFQLNWTKLSDSTNSNTNTNSANTVTGPSHNAKYPTLKGDRWKGSFPQHKTLWIFDSKYFTKAKSDCPHRWLSSHFIFQQEHKEMTTQPTWKLIRNPSVWFHTFSSIWSETFNSMHFLPPSYIRMYTNAFLVPDAYVAYFEANTFALCCNHSPATGSSASELTCLLTRNTTNETLYIC